MPSDVFTSGAYADPALRTITYLSRAWDTPSPAKRVESVRDAAATFREAMLEERQVCFYRSFELVRVPYPTRFGLLNACSLPTPYLHICNRLFIIQFHAPDGIKTLLVSPSDTVGNEETPFFKRLAGQFDMLGPLEAAARGVIAPIKYSVKQCLDLVGIAPEQVDYITYDHLHTQDLRRWLGEGGLFPNAKLLVMRQEWETACDPSPPQRDWYCPNGTEGIAEERVVLLDGDVMLGEGVALVRTPGHTEGNHSIVAHTPEGLMVTSENGVGPDAYAPEHSEIPGLKAYARETGMEVVLNGNTLERGLDQYVSMILEKTIAGPSVRDPRFPNVVCSSEFDAFWAFPGIRPTFAFGDLSFGRPHVSRGS